jgi:hypothetical protein
MYGLVTLIIAAAICIALRVAFSRKKVSINSEDVPVWVRKAQYRWEAKLGRHPYDMTKRFYGRSWVYECHFYTVGQGQCTESWCKYLRHRKLFKQ